MVQRTGQCATRGFTIVELLIVVVVIAILAAITIVAYNGIQDRAQDSRMKTAAGQVEKAIRLWGLDNGAIMKGGWGSTTAAVDGKCSDGSGGFFGSTTYTCTVEDALVSANLLPKGFSTKLPANKYYSPPTGGRLSMMVYACGTGRYALYWTLRIPTADDTANLTSIISTCSNYAGIQTTYGMQAAKIIDLN